MFFGPIVMAIAVATGQTGGDGPQLGRAFDLAPAQTVTIAGTRQ